MSCHGIWYLASFINHSCIGNVYRAFIGDMMIIRAARDIDADTEVSFWYTAPGSNSPVNTNHWGFICSCELCNDVRGTAASVLMNRERLRSMISYSLGTRTFLELDDMEAQLAELTETYVRPASEVPRFAVWDLQFSLARTFDRFGAKDKVVEHALKGFEALGFVIEGFAPRGQELVVEQWGVVIYGLVEAWIMLYMALITEAPELAPSADRYARLTYLMCVGENNSYDAICGLQSGRRYGPAQIYVEE